MRMVKGCICVHMDTWSASTFLRASFVCIYMSVCLNVAKAELWSYFGSTKGSLLLPVGADMYVEREVCFRRPVSCMHMAEGLECLMACKACMWHRRGEVGIDPSPVKRSGCATVQHWLGFMTQKYVASIVNEAKLPLSLWQIPSGSDPLSEPLGSYFSALVVWSGCWYSFCSGAFPLLARSC